MLSEYMQKLKKLMTLGLMSGEKLRSGEAREKVYA